MKRTIKVCKRCSNVDVDELKAQGRSAGVRVKIGCVHGCASSHSELRGSAFGLVDGELLVRPTQIELIQDALGNKEGSA
ncbi:hypothetical protein [Thermophilibacter immobilis]|jgi:hypothetical protein|uniref:DUF1450 domain-containing protein n=1 Tax=Thermophilibacter immobilis TaxID=2779519 RepID=A0A7S7M9D4_9ACTN|nr:hypothetical protein [Thermophilibacter immobilis]QOY61033.1 hypothetical protein INP52_02150 [Thermophilibacter immobilis]